VTHGDADGFVARVPTRDARNPNLLERGREIWGAECDRRDRRRAARVKLNLDVEVLL
jgi:hypothetical protein